MRHVLSINNDIYAMTPCQSIWGSILSQRFLSFVLASLAQVPLGYYFTLLLKDYLRFLTLGAGLGTATGYVNGAPYFRRKDPTN